MIFKTLLSLWKIYEYDIAIDWFIRYLAHYFSLWFLRQNEA